MFFKMKIGALIAISLSMTTFCWAEDAAPFSVKAVAPDRPSLLFSENEPVNVKALVNGGAGPVQVEYTVKETCGNWSAKGSLAMPRKGGDAVEAKIPLSFPGRGHFKLNVVAKCGDIVAEESTAAAIVYQPRPADIASPWGIMWGVYRRGVPDNLNKNDAPAYIAENMRMLGASWTRLNFWEGTYKAKVEGDEVVLDLSRMRRQVDEFRKRGINILGEFVQTPRVLSSKPDSIETRGDAGPLYCRVKPADYRLWDQMVEKIAREFKDEIPVWEIWNEPDITDGYWVGTKEEFVELVNHTSAAIRKGSPSAKIASAGFTSSAKRCIPFFDAGFGKNIDILTVHYTDRRDNIGEFLKIEKEHGLQLPIVDTEESVTIPLNNLARGVRSFKFIHMIENMPEYVPLMRTDWKITPAAVTYSVGARLIGSKKFQRMKEFPGFKAYFFGDEGDIAAIIPNSVKLMHFIDRILVKTVPVDGRDVIGIDALGRERKLSGGTGEIPFSFTASLFKENRETFFATPECAFISGCKDIASVEGISSSNKNTIVVEAESGDFDREKIKADTQNNSFENNSFSGGRFLNIHSKDAPGEKGYGADLKVNVPVEGDYQVFFSGNNLNRLKKPSSLSPFYWSFDNGPKTQAGEKPFTVIGGIGGAPEGLSELGTVHLTKGEHIFHLRLTAPRERPDKNWALWFDAIALMPVQ